MKTISIIGAGNMGGAIARGLSQGSIFAAENITVCDISEANLSAITKFNPRICTSLSNVEGVKNADIVVIAVKPWLTEPILDEIKSVLNYDSQLLVSIVAGISFDQMYSFLEKDDESTTPTIFRVIPNTAIDVLQSVSTIASSNASKEQEQEILSIFNELGKAFLVPSESQLNAFMSLSSCGIAYAFRYIRAAMEGGVEMGMYPEVAKQVVLQTLRGAVELLEKNGTHPEVEIDKVTTPGGITIKGLNELEAQGFSNAVIKGLKASFLK
ncbi:MAG: pyrroline-5-carboxylate reductase [Paludibacteraceae bacterium]|nr:pyrroline-5-carboxylate reductase [Paludibacteraceae bacterium]MBP6285091.1 pyrroline-5-carboxylate reductase [Paludibacteraceae bacterium]